VYYLFFFFFSSRRRHTRSKRDWSSDVCSSDLVRLNGQHLLAKERRKQGLEGLRPQPRDRRERFLRERLPHHGGVLDQPALLRIRSEERRVGKECRSRWSRSQ